MFFVNDVAVGLSKAPQFGQLVFCTLIFMLSRDTGVEGEGCHSLKILQ
jgi:hypothetical protein